MIRRATLVLFTAAIVLAGLVPATAEPLFPELDYGLLVILAAAAAAASGLAWARTGPAQMVPVATVARASALWAGCAVALAASLVAVATDAQTLELRNLVAAQQNTHLYALQQPVAATVFVLALALAGDDSALQAAFGQPSRPREASLLAAVLACGALGATVFLGGYVGPALPAPLWLALKSAFLAGVVVMARGALRRLPDERRVLLAWTLVPVAALNLVVTMGVLTG